MTGWTYCQTIIPAYEDLLVLAGAINHGKRRMWAIQYNPDENGYDEDSAAEIVEDYLFKLGKLHKEYALMVKAYWPNGRTA